MHDLESGSEAFSSNQDVEKNREEETNPIEALNDRVQGLMDFKREIEKLEKKGITGEDAKDRVEELVESVKYDFCPDFDEKMEEWERLMRKAGDLNSIHLDIEFHNYEDDDFFEQRNQAEMTEEELKQAYQELNKELESLETPGFSAAKEMDLLLASYENKMKQVERVKNDQEAIREIMEESGYENIPSEGIREVQMGVANVDILIDEDAWGEWEDLVGQPCAGFYSLRTPFCFSRLTGEGGTRDCIVAHERLHNYLSPVVSHELATDSLENLKDLKQGSLGSSAIKSELENLNNREIIDSLNDEIIANTPAYFGEGLDKYISKVDLEDEKSVENAFLDYCGEMSTAGSLARDYYEELVSLSAKEDLEEEVRNSAREKAENFRRSFVSRIRKMRDSWHVASMLGDDAEDAMQGFMFLVDPSKYRHAKKILSYRYGENRVESAYEVLETVKSFNDKPDNLDQIIGILQSENPMKDRLVEFLRNTLSDRVDIDTFILGGRQDEILEELPDIEDLKRRSDKVHVILNEIGLNLDKEPDELMWEAYIKEAIYACSDLESLKEMLEKCPKDILQSAIKERLDFYSAGDFKIPGQEKKIEILEQFLKQL